MSRKLILIALTGSLVCWGILAVLYVNRPILPATAVAISIAPLHVPSKAATKTVYVRAARRAPTVETYTIPADLRGSVFFQGSTSLPEVALTFDDGPNAVYTPQILSILEQYGVKATFFCIGEQVPANTRIVQQVYNDGDIIASHTWSHPNLTTLSATSIQAQLHLTSDAIENAIGVHPTLFRPPYGAYNNFVQGQVAQTGLATVMWNVDTRDWTRPGVYSIVNTALATVRNGSIILMHDGGGNRSETVEALPIIIRALHQRGFKLVTMIRLIIDTHKLDAMKSINSPLVATTGYQAEA
ncbi:MAG TPA: polysaccharide deacetylase family protein [Ktedonobacteraceae bacterium]